MLRILALCLVILLFSLPAQTADEQEVSPTSTPSRTLTATATSRPAIRRSTETPTQTLTPTPQAYIRAPLDGQALQGNLLILGSSAVTGFISAEVSFAYEKNPTNTWFLIASSSKPVSDGTLAEWDTTTITDGEYNLRLFINRQNGDPLVTIVEGLRVRNYSPIETSTPTPVTPTATPLPGELSIPTPTPTPTITPPAPTPTDLARNPAQVSVPDIALSLGKGALAILGLFALMGIYQAVKNIREKG